MQNLDSLRYPIGEFVFGRTYSPEETRAHIAQIATLPVKLTELVGKWGDERLDQPYRPDGWTVRQLVHHIADSHINAYVRTKLLLTEDNPTIKPYEEGAWATLPDAEMDVAPSLVILANLHRRWAYVLERLPESAFTRTLFHPGSKIQYVLPELLAHYAWHGEHHYQHIARLAERNGWA